MLSAHLLLVAPVTLSPLITEIVNHFAVNKFKRVTVKLGQVLCQFLSEVTVTAKREDKHEATESQI